MADYDSDSSDGGNDIETNVLLGYASKEETSDTFSQLGGRPTWLDNTTTLSGALAKCKVCNGASSLLLQLNADLAERFPGHERRLYVFGCRKKTCRRREGSIRAFRGVRMSEVPKTEKKEKAVADGTNGSKQQQHLGETLFGAKSPTPAQSAQANPFAAPSGASGRDANPFAAPKPGTTENASLEPDQSSSTIDDLPQTFAQKARISSPPPAPEPQAPSEPWQDDPSPYPSYHLDADKEYLEAEPDSIPANARLDNPSEGGSAADNQAAFESSMDKTFQRFADRLSQNPEQILRYEFEGQPQLYSKGDKVGKLLALPEAGNARVQTASSASGSKMPRCAHCGAARAFEMQLTPHAITELEAEDMSVEGMDWGTIIVGSCAEDCQQKGKGIGEVGYVEEWVGVQWEEVAGGRKK